MVEIASETAVRYTTGLFTVLLRWVLVCDPYGDFQTQALLCTDLDADPQEIVSWYVMRWQLEVTFQEVRRHLGFETQRQWSEMAIQRTTPALLGLFSLIALFAHGWMRQTAGTFRRQAAWYPERGIPPSPMRWRWCERSCGPQRLFTGRPHRPTR